MCWKLPTKNKEYFDYTKENLPWNCTIAGDYEYYTKRDVRVHNMGSLCFWFDNCLNSCLSKRHSLSNHFLFEDVLKRFCFKSIIFSTFSSEVFTSWICVLSLTYSRIRVWRTGERLQSLNYCVESFSQTNALIIA